ncbi:sporulation protein [Bacillus glycinifermentans]|uniref:Sporulation YhaL family protein n=1 Tax=Bacillus glycinifermentans TaxID=1664069 RepID=A0A0J6F0F0_9BACI|nr:sporulation YhaL family protein [Bacillus glycinifermentans]ATH94931.1 sporulation protein [Bacillus glycinifermentans]KMM63538.1 sporulation protein [Bacillus glycinifermentans]KRT93122.1 sporulation protein [Bacillus glycinifermentans]MEC0487712.1 sporulation YhaL family protein [Bacillus glycinifermentans]MEC0493830.1 sporulation YhaL family protein [Bacillus glycinifermentans]
MLLFPWWVYLCIVGIVFSAYKLMSTAKEEEKIDQAFIEKEGRVYIERMEKERERRMKQSSKKQEQHETGNNHSIA